MTGGRIVVRVEVVLWLQAAEEDLYDADLALENKRWFRVAFYAQQAVAKALKAPYFIFGREPPPYTHRITVLYHGLKERGFMLPVELEEKLPALNKYYTVTRYPDAANGLPSESVDEEEARRAVDLARKVVEAVKSEVERHTP